GKVDRNALTDSEASRSSLAEDYVAPRTKAEQQLTEIWSSVLGVERVGVRDNFFELGGDSILSIQVVSRAKRAGIQVTPKQIFELQTVRELALQVQLSSSIASDQQPMVGDVILTPIQCWFFEQSPSNPHHFN